MLLRTRELLRRLPGPEEGATIHGAEVGVYRGQMSAELLRSRPDLYLVMVDNWAPHEIQPDRYRGTGDYHAHLTGQEQWRNARRSIEATNFASGRRAILADDSRDAASMVPDGSLDFVFIDADHSYEGVRGDIRAWLPKLRGDGVLGGHDYDHEGGHDFGVNEAVDEACEAFGWGLETGGGSTWWALR